MVKKGYRDPPYHNWMHAFSVSHFCYLLHKNLGLSNYLEYGERHPPTSAASLASRMLLTVISSSVYREIEILALFVSCMCHDLDHRGTNNSFQVASVRENSALLLHCLPAVLK